MHITIHLGLLVLWALCSFLAGLVFRFLQARYLKNQLLQLEREKLENHAEILQLHKKLSELRAANENQNGTPVVQFKEKEANQPTDAGKNKRAQ
ncbi:hypothetical protein [Flavihumibacter petaseus]|uniref:Uncharacterized protein n=1 Tax=Flavihumibacter petaseus NBRC 106054 TaxID=1220578 RepID=A0A0E9MVS2_9BACT|nr:hypothetical protein [Flavihumibacter petaseus]GAO41684.1 hypothetical protein FPE01S_01_06980 [Flavihumibacter petaseus NBRC 106054]